MDENLYMTSKSQGSSSEPAVIETAKETNMVFIAYVYEFEDGRVGLLKRGIDYNSFKGAVVDEITNPTPPEEQTTLLDLLIDHWKRRINEEQALFYTFSFLTSTPLVSRSTLDTYKDTETFGAILRFKESDYNYKVYTLTSEKWNECIEDLEKRISKQSYLSRLQRQTVDTFFELNYDLHHAAILDKDDVGVRLAETRINNSIDIFASIFNKINNNDTITYEQDVESMKALNSYAYEQTRQVVLEYGRNHCIGE